MYDNDEKAVVHNPCIIQEACISEGKLTINMGDYVLWMKLENGMTAYDLINNLRALSNNVLKEEGI